MKNFIEVVKANKGAFIKRGLVVVGTAVGLAVVGALRSRTDEDEMDEPDVIETDDFEEIDSGNSPEDE